MFTRRSPKLWVLTWNPLHPTSIRASAAHLPHHSYFIGKMTKASLCQDGIDDYDNLLPQLEPDKGFSSPPPKPYLSTRPTSQADFPPSFVSFRIPCAGNIIKPAMPVPS